MFNLFFAFYIEMLFDVSFRSEYTQCPVENYVTCDGLKSSNTDVMLYKRPGIHTVRVGFFLDDRISTASAGYLLGAAITRMNKSLERSGVNIRVEPAFLQQVDIERYYSGVDDIRPVFFDFEDWQTKSPWKEHRNVVFDNKADFIHLLLDNKVDWNACGAGRKYTGDNYPVGITACYSQYDVAAWDPDQNTSTEYILEHELGHQFGLEHDEPNASGQPFIEGGYGYQEDAIYGSIMSYAKIRLPYYSNPDLTVKGIKNGSETANAVKALNAVAPKLSMNYEDNLR